MQKLVTILLATAALAGCANDNESASQADWTRGDGCERFFSETPRELANCRAFVKSNEEKEREANVSLEKAGDEVSRTKGLKQAEPTERTLTE
jgi:hypothetical protein